MTTPSSPVPGRPRARYRAYRLYRAQMLGMFAFFIVIGAALLAAPNGSAGGPPGWFMALWCAALVWNAYWWLFRVAYVLELSDTELRWRAPLARGTVPVRALREVRPARFGSNVEVFAWDGGRPVLIMVAKGMSDFLGVLSEIAPRVPSRIGWQGRWSARFGWRRSWFEDLGGGHAG